MRSIKAVEQSVWRYIRAHWLYFSVVAAYFVLVVIVAAWNPFAVQAIRLFPFDKTTVNRNSGQCGF